MGMYDSGKGSQMVVTVKRQELLDIVTKNRDLHEKEAADAKVAYGLKLRQTVLLAKRALNKYAIALRDPDSKAKYPSAEVMAPYQLQNPVSYVGEYDRAIGMLKLHSKDEMTIDMATYQKFVEDDWEFTRGFKAMSSSYLGG